MGHLHQIHRRYRHGGSAHRIRTSKMPMSWSPDGKFIVYWLNDPKTNADQWVLPLAGDRKPFPILQTPFGEIHSQISPDGKWISYTSSETRRQEIYIRP